jgi:hypothetical protein
MFKKIFKKIGAFFNWLKKFLGPYFLLFYLFVFIIYWNRADIWAFIVGIINTPDPTIGLW